MPKMKLCHYLTDGIFRARECPMAVNSFLLHTLPHQSSKDRNDSSLQLYGQYRVSPRTHESQQSLMSSTTAAKISSVWENLHSPEGFDFLRNLKSLSEHGVTRHRIDYVTGTITAYRTGENGQIEAHATPLPEGHDVPKADTKWDVEALTAAIRAGQTQSVPDYHTFSKAVVAAGVTDYTVYIDGGKVVYSDALGDSHTVWLPGAKKD